MNFPESHLLLPCVVGLAISAVLLWLASEIFAVARTRMRPTALRLKACAVLLGEFGLWWPGHFLAPLDAGSVLGIPFLAGGLAWGAGRARLITAVAATRKTVPAFAGLAVITLLVAYAHSVFATPGALPRDGRARRLGPGHRRVRPCHAPGRLSLEFKPSKKLRVARIGSAVLCAILLTLAASVSAETDPATVAGVGRSRCSSARWVRWRWRCSRRCTAPAAATTSRRGARVSAAPTVDSLTQLPTRVYFEDRLAAAATKADANASRLALLFIDLDGFKPVNDTYGHSIGDIVLEQVGQRLKAMSRGKDVVARVGGDEFLLLLSNVTTQEGIAHVADRLIQGLSQPYQVEGREVMISCSVGIAIYPDGAATPS